MKSEQVVFAVLSYLKTRLDLKKIVFSAIQGGYARNTFNKESDIDILIAYRNKDDVVDRELRHFNFANYRMGVKFLYLDEMTKCNEWLERVRYIFSNETMFIYGDHLILDQIIESCRLTKCEQSDILIFCLKRCARRGIFCNSTKVLNLLHSSDFTTNYDSSIRLISTLGKKRKTYWILRNDYLSAKLLCWSALEYIIIMIFSLNFEFTPSPKYRYYLLQKLKWLPKSIAVLFEYIEQDTEVGYWDLHILFCNIISECILYALQNEILISDNEDYVLTTTLPMFRESETIRKTL